MEEKVKKKNKFKPFDITFHIGSADEAKIFLTIFEGSPHLFAQLIDKIKEKTKYSE